MQDALKEASQKYDSKISINTTRKFKENAENYRLMFTDINAITTSLQTRMYTLKQCREALNSLIDESNNMRNEIDNHWYNNDFQSEYIAQDTDKIKQSDKIFIDGVIKIQSGEHKTLTRREQNACK